MRAAGSCGAVRCDGAGSVRCGAAVCASPAGAVPHPAQMDAVSPRRAARRGCWGAALLGCSHNADVKRNDGPPWAHMRLWGLSRRELSGAVSECTGRAGGLTCCSSVPAGRVSWRYNEWLMPYLHARAAAGSCGVAAAGPALRGPAGTRVLPAALQVLLRAGTRGHGDPGVEGPRDAEDMRSICKS